MILNQIFNALIRTAQIINKNVGACVVYARLYTKVGIIITIIVTTDFVIDV